MHISVILWGLWNSHVTIMWQPCDGHVMVMWLPCDTCTDHVTVMWSTSLYPTGVDNSMYYIIAASVGGFILLLLLLCCVAVLVACCCRSQHGAFGRWGNIAAVYARHCVDNRISHFIALQNVLNRRSSSAVLDNQWSEEDRWINMFCNQTGVTAVF